MKHCYSRIGGNASATVIHFDDGDHALLTSIKVQQAFRREGHGTALLEDVCADADREGVTLILNVESYMDGGLDDMQLWTWYERFGFRGNIDLGIGMTRPPRTNPSGSAATPPATATHPTPTARNT